MNVMEEELHVYIYINTYGSFYTDCRDTVEVLEMDLVMKQSPKTQRNKRERERNGRDSEKGGRKWINKSYVCYMCVCIYTHVYTYTIRIYTVVCAHTYTIMQYNRKPRNRGNEREYRSGATSALVMIRGSF